MRVVLKVTSGSSDGRSVMLRAGQSLQVGRTEWADLALPHDDRISGIHFALSCDSQRCVLRDLDSTNGTTVNGNRVMEVELQDGDQIVAGRTSFLVSVETSDSVLSLAPSSSASAASAPTVVDTTPSDEQLASVAHENVASVQVEDTVPEQSFLSPALAIVSDANRPYTSGLQDPDSVVRRMALYAAAWTRQGWLLEFCRRLARRPAADNWEALYLLAILGQPADLEHILAIGRTKGLGSRRFAAYAAFGHPRVVRDLLVEIENKDPNTAVAAGVAFTKITGANIDSEKRVALQPEDGAQPDEFEQEFLEEAFLPSPPLAHAYWNERKDDFARGVRWRRGVEISHPLENNLLDSLDMEARWQARLRIHFEGQAHLSPVDATLQLVPRAES